MAMEPSTNPWLWPAIAATRATAAALSTFGDLFGTSATRIVGAPEPDWTTPNGIVVELTTMRLRDFSRRSVALPTLILAPYALHGATVADFAREHSVIECLLGNGVSRLLLAECRSATAEMRDLSV